MAVAMTKAFHGAVQTRWWFDTAAGRRWLHEKVRAARHSSDVVASAKRLIA
jgi:hypothetical protein